MKIDIQYRLARWFERTVWLFVCLCATVLLPSARLQAQVETERILFYNVENAFWPEDDPARDDDEFTPEGTRHWTMTRLRQKLYHLSRVIVAAGGGRAPMLVGLAEVEGDSVMNFWTHRTPLRKLGYRYIVTDGPDVRGIQMALLYHPASFRLLHHETHHVPMPEGERPTRPLLHAAGRLITGDTLDVIVVHQPSRLGGEKQTQAKRDAARTTLLHLADSLSAARQHPYLIMMGDMNESPRSEVVMQSGEDASKAVPFVNLMYGLHHKLLHDPTAIGTHKYQGEWSLIDHFIVHPSLLQEGASLRLADPRIFVQPFMLTDDPTHLGQRPFRSYYGYRYEGGYSDHLPILIDLQLLRQ